MAAIISDNVLLSTSLVNGDLSSLPIDSRKIVEWKCGECGGRWREMVCKRGKYKHCPNCSPDGKKRSAKVIFPTNQSNTQEQIIPKTTLSQNWECPVCYLDNHDPSTVANCHYGECGYKCCKDCLKQYILTGTGRAKCMDIECGKEIPLTHLVKLFGRKWVNSKKKGEYTHHLIKVLLNEERAKIPSTMPFVALDINREEMARKQTSLKIKMNNLC